MDKEDIIRMLSNSHVEVKGDFVIEKKVQYEVNQVDPGGIGILIGDKEMAERLLAKHTVSQPTAEPHHKESAAAEQAVASRKTASNCQPATNSQPSATPNGTEPAAAEQAAASRKTVASSQPIAEQPTVDQTSANSQWTGNDPMSHPTASTHPSGQGASHPTPQYRALFIRNDGSSAENREVREQEQKRFMKYLKNYRLTNHVLTCASDNPLNDVVTGFVLKWINRKLIHSNPTGTAIFRFLTVDCGLQSEVSDRSYGNKIMTRIKLRHCSNKTRDNINLYFD